MKQVMNKVFDFLALILAYILTFPVRVFWLCLNIVGELFDRGDKE